MALRWEANGLDTEHGYLGGTRLFTLLHPVRTENGHYVLSSDLPGHAAGRLVVQQHSSAAAARHRADTFLLGWLHGYLKEAQRTEASARIPGQTDGQKPYTCRTCTGQTDRHDTATDTGHDGQTGADSGSHA